MCHCSKPLTYGIALDQLGSDVVHQYVGQEPSGRNFNELVLDYNSESTSLSCAFFVIEFLCRYQYITDKASHITSNRGSQPTIHQQDYQIYAAFWEYTVYTFLFLL
jgi:hypothetical protein